MNRELIYQGVLDLLKEKTNAVSYSRRLKDFNQMSVSETPAIFLVQNDENCETITGMPTKWTFKPEIYIYVNTGDNSGSDISPYTYLNPIIDEVISVFDAFNNSYGKQTLNDLVHTIKLAGKVETDGGSLGGIAIARLNLEIIVAK